MVYLDNSATTKPCESTIQAVRQSMEEGWFNPSSLYKPSMEAQKAMNQVREDCLRVINARNQELYFTSGGTEADNLAILGKARVQHRPGKVLLFSLDHPAVLSCSEELERMGHRVEMIPVDRFGLTDLTQLEQLMDSDVFLISVMQVNNEVGSVQPLQAIVEMKKRVCPNAHVHVDGVQGFLRVPISFNQLGIDSYAFSGHKIHALKGIGALVIRKDAHIRPILFGGGQEQGIRSGTENTTGILALDAAVNAYNSEKNQYIRQVKLRLLREIRSRIPDVSINGPDPETAESAPHILNLAFCPVRSQTMLFALEGDGIFVSAGSACASRKQKISGVLKAMNVDTTVADCSLRFSLSPENTEEEMVYVAERIKFHYDMLKKYTRR